MASSFCFPRLCFSRIQLFEDFSIGPVGLGIGGVDITPHRVGNYAVEGAQLSFVAELGIFEGVTDLDLTFHVMNNHFMLAIAQVSAVYS